ncbi:MAG: N-acetyltransferase [Acidimicrobiaceae bacterium]|nr:N-acetyltransferase [Acidimicrobiaceae bacterium]
MTEIRRGSLEDVPAVARCLASAFSTDPVASFIFPDPDRRAAGLERFFALQLRRSYLPRGEAWVAGDAEAAALWVPPDALAPRLADVLAHLSLVTTLGARVIATRRLARLLASYHPRTRHWYLGTIGTLPHRQGRGVGTALMEPVLARCDASGLPAYLECSRLENVAFYARQGFGVERQVVVPDGGPPLWLMWRPPLSRRPAREDLDGGDGARG